MERNRNGGRAAALLLALAAAACGTGEKPAAREAVVIDTSHTGSATASAAAAVPADSGDVIYDDLDRQIFERKVAWAQDEHLDTLPIGQILVRVGRTFVGTKYTPHTLEMEGPERLVLNLRELDCVTFVENMLALSRVIREHGDFGDFQSELRRIRYRGGRIAGYASRLHYFSEWIRDNERLHLVRDITREIGGVRDTTALYFMSSHTTAYRQLADSATLSTIRQIEARISRQPRYYVPEDSVAAVESRLQDGDILAMTSTVDGLDVAHTGIAIRMPDGRIHLLNAPLVGKSVQISELPIADRLASIKSQDGLMAARPL